MMNFTFNRHAVIKTIFLLSSCVLTLIGCSRNSKMNNESANQSYYTESKVKSIHSNRTAWNRKVASAEKREPLKYTEELQKHDITLKSLDEYRKNKVILVQGTVLNLQTGNQSIIPTTKIIIHVDNVLSGDKKLLNTNLKFFTEGGLIPKNNYSTPDGQSPENNGKMVYVTRSKYPLPAIGGKVVISLKKSKIDYGGKADKIKQFDPLNVEEEYWVYNSKMKKYVINDKLIQNLDEKEKSQFKSLFKLTDEINKSIN